MSADRRQLWPLVAAVVSVTCLACVGGGTDPVTEDVTEDECPGPASTALQLDGFPTFEDIALQSGVQDALRRNRGAGTADFDGDGRLDLYLSNPADPATLLPNRGEDGFVESPGAPSTFYDTSVAIADYDADGDPDVFLACGGYLAVCQNGLFRNEGFDSLSSSVEFTDVTSEAGLAATLTANFGAAWADYDGDGDLDLYAAGKLADIFPPEVAEPASADQLFRNDGDGTFTDVAMEAGIAHVGSNHQAAWFDMELDGDMDVFVPTLGGGNKLYRNDGDGTFTDVTTGPLEWPYWAFGALAEDFDNDGDFDLLVSADSGSVDEATEEHLGHDHEHDWTVASRDHHRLFLNDGDGAFRDASVEVGLAACDGSLITQTMGFQAGDVDLDGWWDVLLGNGVPETGSRNVLLTFMPDVDGALRAVDRTPRIDVPAIVG